MTQLDAIRTDLRAAVRGLSRTRAVSLAAIVMLALGIGANTAIFSVLRASSLRSSPLPNPERIVVITTMPPGQPDTIEQVRIAEYFAWRESARSFDAIGTILGGWTVTAGAATDGEPAERLVGWRFNASSFRAFGVQPALGRFFTEEEDRIDGPLDVVVISDGLWRRRFGASPAAIGQSMLLDGTPTRVIGVMPPDFDVFGVKGDFWLPSVFTRFQVQSRSPNRVLGVVARLKEGVTRDTAQADMNAVAAAFEKADPGPQKGRGVRVQSLDVALFGNLRPLLGALQGAVGFVLLIACANVAGLLLIRAGVQLREVAVRQALGASRARIIRLYLTESLVLAIAGGSLGILLARSIVGTVDSMAPGWLSPIQHIDVDTGVLAFSVIASVLTGLVFGMVPAFGFSPVSLFTSLKDSMRTTSVGRSHRRLQGALVVAQVTLTLILLVGAGLLIRSFWELQRVPLGLDSERVVWFQTRLPANTYFRQIGLRNGFAQLDVSPVPAQRFEQVRERLSQLPGVASVAGTNEPPVTGAVTMAPFRIPGRNVADGTAASSGVFATGGGDLLAGYSLVTPDYFSTLRIPVLRGREFTTEDREASQQVAMVNETMARRYWPNENPIGQQVVVSIVDGLEPRTIVGVVGDTPTHRMGMTVPTLYVPHRQESLRSRVPYGQSRVNITYMMRIDQPLSIVGPALRRAVADIDRSLPVTGLEPLDDFYARQIDSTRDSMVILAVFGAVALLLAGCGIYGIVAYGVAQRAREIGIRMALGASRGGVLTLLLRESTALTVVGIVLGLAGAAVTTRYLQSMLFNLTPLDPSTFALTPLFFVVIALLASYVPARRATRIDPHAVLRCE